MKKICVVTGNRAEFGLLFWLIQEIKKEKSLKLNLVVTGAHLVPKFGNTYKEVSKNFKNIKKIPSLYFYQGDVDVSKSVSLTIANFDKYFEKSKPDLVVILGDRFEIFGVATAAYFKKIPIAHIAGGELTYGAFDDQLRHAITKLSNLHFAFTKEYSKRVIQLGENPKNVFNVGTISLDNIKNLLPQNDLCKKLNIDPKNKILTVTFHPVTTDLNETKTGIKNLLKALHQFPEYQIIFTQSTSDPGSDFIMKEIQKFIKTHKNSKLIKNLGSQVYLSLLKYSSAVIGNSSSGIIEAPAMRCPTINIGTRQGGRLQAASIIQTSTSASEIVKALKKISSESFQKKLKTSYYCPYGFASKNVSKKIVKIIKKTKKFPVKEFYDL